MTPQPQAAGPRRTRPGVLRRRADFDRIYKQGRRQRTPLLTIVTLAQEPPGEARVAYVVSRKVDKRAVVRNQVRRRLREALRRFLTPPWPQVDLIVIAHPASAQADYWQLRAALRDALRRAGIPVKADVAPVQETER